MNQSFPTQAFSCFVTGTDTEIGKTLLQRGALVHVAGRLKADDWNGRNGVELEIDDAADPRLCHG